MTRRSALLAGLAALIVLLGGQVIGSWNRQNSARTTLLGSGQRQPVVAAATGTPEPAVRATPPAPATPAPVDTPVPPTTRAAAPATPRTDATPAGTPPMKPYGKLGRMGVKSVTGNGEVLLTFDDGPHPVHTPQILAQLRAHRVHAMFCVVGSEARRYPALVAQIAREGHTLCNHSWQHDFEMGQWSTRRIRANLNATNAAIHRAAPGARIAYFRQPGGRWTSTLVRVARDMGMESLGWTVDPKDWDEPPARRIASHVQHYVRPGYVILMHDGGGDRRATVAACRTLIPALKRRYPLARLG